MNAADFFDIKKALDDAEGTIESLERQIREGEHQQQDFKFRIDSTQKIAKTLSAFANTDGGKLLIGVKDNGKITGIDPQEEYHMIEGAATLFCKPAIAFSYAVYMNEEEKLVLEINIPSSKERPHYAKSEEGKWLAYIRQDDQNFLANRVLIRYMKDRNPETKRKNMVAYGPEERCLFDLLAKEKEISLSRFKKASQLPIHKAEEILATFLKWGVITSKASQKGIRFSLA